MKIAVLGTGRVGSVLGRRWAEMGHHVVFGSRDPAAAKVRELAAKCGPAASVATWKDAVAAGEVVVFAVPWNVARAVIDTAGDLSGKVIVDCVNPLNEDFSGLDLGHTTSASEKIAHWAVGAKVVKAFNTVSSVAMDDPNFDGEKATMFFCGDDAGAKAVVGELASQLGFEAVDAGPLAIARYLEPLAMLYIQLAIQEGWGANYAFRIMRR